MFWFLAEIGKRCRTYPLEVSAIGRKCQIQFQDLLLIELHLQGDGPGGCLWTGSECQSMMFTMITSECMMLSSDECMDNPDCVDMDSIMEDLMFFKGEDFISELVVFVVVEVRSMYTRCVRVENMGCHSCKITSKVYSTLDHQKPLMGWFNAGYS